MRNLRNKSLLLPKRAQKLPPSLNNHQATKAKSLPLKKQSALSLLLLLSQLLKSNLSQSQWKTKMTNKEFSKFALEDSLSKLMIVISETSSVSAETLLKSSFWPETMVNQKELLLLNSLKNLHSTKLSNSTEVNISEDPSLLRNPKRKISITEVASEDKKEDSVVNLHSVVPLKEMLTSKPQLSSSVVFHTTPLLILFPASSVKSVLSVQQE